MFHGNAACVTARILKTDAVLDAVVLNSFESVSYYAQNVCAIYTVQPVGTVGVIFLASTCILFYLFSCFVCLFSAMGRAVNDDNKNFSDVVVIVCVFFS